MKSGDAPEPLSMATDPVCGMHVDPAAPKGGAHEHAGHIYYFCNPRCREKFHTEPERYLAPVAIAPVAIAPVAEQPRTTDAGPVEYICPMDPEIVRSEPGACPICGMALEPRTAAVSEAENPELTDMRRRFWVSLALTAPVFGLSMSEMLPGQPVHHAIGATLSNWILFALTTPVVLWGGRPFFERGWASIVNRRLNMFTLIAIGTGTAFGYSVVATIWPGVFPDAFRGHGGAVPIYFEAAAVITTLVLMGQVLELRARSRTNSAIRALLGLTPAARTMCRSKACGPAIGCGYARGRKCPSTASSSTVAARLMNQW
jgi:Cu+-exporting ATPase